MRVSYKWLQEYVELGNVGPQELAEKMTLSGVAVENLEELGAGIEKVVVGKIITITKHPDADKLVVCKITTGTEELQIVTGADNIREEDIVPVALVGAKLPSGLKIKKSKLRGVESAGMLCSAEELGIDKKYLSESEQKGILILSEDTPLGEDIKPVLGLDDTILELELTPNRSDCLSMVGVAYEVAAVLGTAVKLPEIKVEETAEEISGLCTIEIGNPELCNRYVARIIRNIEIKSSPQWMQQRLRAAGVRPISNIVDITNYVMLELGQPLHAFDYNTLAERRIIVRTAKAGEKMLTLDNSLRELSPEMLVIADAQKAVAVAGVMGGLETEVTAKTADILLESAQFNGASIRRTSRKLGLRSEASSRFEKGVDGAGCLNAADRAAQLMAQLGAGSIVKGYVDNCVVPIEESTVKLRLNRVTKVLGIEISKENILQIFSNLKFDVEDLGSELMVKIPTFRGDITLEEDLIEEIARLYGYNNIPTTLPTGATTVGKLTREQNITEVIRNVMISSGLNEVVTLAFSSPKNLDMLKVPAADPLRQAVVIQNPLTEDQSTLRTTLVPGLLGVLSRNYSRRIKDMGIFEVATIFKAKAEAALPEERVVLAFAAMGQSVSTWNQKGQVYDFFALKGILETLFDTLGIAGLSYEADKANPSFHPGRTATILAAEKNLGVLGQLHPDVVENFDLPDGVIACQIDITDILKITNLQKLYQPLPKFPAIERDLAFVAKEDLKAEAILALIKSSAGSLLKEVTIFDVYQGKQIEEGYKSMAFTLKYQATDRTLTDEEVNLVQKKLAVELRDKMGVEIRG